MSPITTIAEIGKHEGESVTLRGWLYNLRESGKLLFPQFRDGSGGIPGRVPKNGVSPDVFDAIKTLTQESSVIVEGKVRADKRAHGGYELDVTNVQVVQRVPESSPYPITPKEHGTDFLMEHRHLWVRSQRQAAILRVRAEIIKAARDFFDERGFTLTDPPIITPAACEGTSRHSSRNRASFMLKRPQWRSARFIPSARRSARKNRRRAAISPNSGWSSLRSPTRNSMT